jgi:hypothetical protein
MSSALPNLDTYLNHLPPADAAQFDMGRNVALAVVGVSIHNGLSVSVIYQSYSNPTTTQQYGVFRNVKVNYV